MAQRDHIERIKEYISYLKKNEFKICRVYLFGSYAKGNYSKDSDIDLAIVMSNIANGYKMQVQLMKISRKFDTRIEPHPFDETDFNSSNPFAHEVLTSGIQIL